MRVRNESRYRQRGPYRLRGYLGAQVDSRGANPLAEYAFWTDPERAQKVAAVAEAPKMFSGGTADVPAFTASGLPPEELLKLPYGIRHAVAAEPDITRVYGYFEDPDLDPDATIPHEGLERAFARVQQWLEETDTRSDAEKAQDAADAEAMAASWAKARESAPTFRASPPDRPAGSYGARPRLTEDFDGVPGPVPPQLGGVA